MRYSMRSVSILIMMAAVVLSACSSIASPKDNAVGGTVWVADEEGNSITVINAATNKVVTTLEGIEGPHNLQVAPDGKTVWAVSGHDALAVMLVLQLIRFMALSQREWSRPTSYFRLTARPLMPRMEATTR